MRLLLPVGLVLFTLISAGPQLLAQVAIESVAVQKTYRGFLQIQGVAGDVTTPPAYAGWFAVEDFSAGTEGRQSGTTAPITVTGDFGRALPSLMLLGIGLTPIPTVRLHMFLEENPTTLLCSAVLTPAYLVSSSAEPRSPGKMRLEFSYQVIDWTWFLPAGAPLQTQLDLNRDPFTFERQSALEPMAYTPRATAFEAFLLVPGAAGEATHRSFTDWIEIATYAMAVRSEAVPTRPGSGPLGAGFTNPVIEGLDLLSNIDRSLIPLIGLSNAGTVLPQVELSVMPPSALNPRYPLLEMKLFNAKIKRVQARGQRTGGATQLTVEFERVEWFTYDQQTGQRLRGCWNLLTNTSC